MGGSESHHTHQDAQGPRGVSEGDALGREREDGTDKEVAARAKLALSATELKCFNFVFAWLAGNSTAKTVKRERLLVSLPFISQSSVWRRKGKKEAVALSVR